MSHDAGSGPASGPPDAGGGFSLAKPLRSFASTVRGVLLEPADFFRGMDRRGGLSGPLVFALLCALISAPLGYLLAPFDPLAPAGQKAGFGEIAERISGMGIMASVLVFALVLVIALLALVLFLYVGAGVYHILVMVCVRNHAGFDATFRVYAYTSAASLLAWIPLLGYLASLYGFYLVFVGVREVHSATSARAAIVALIPVVPFALLIFGPLL